ncbi:FecR family protein [Echinicola marina]|uniref:FecR family protein n=1 Tax=Echinicola marina TaxID=2859768 RepID=UPI001CF61A6E|nr:FecR family protein [Echinicola marina]UCS91648.1 FecR family protein [Echinicola marina]
MDKITFQHLADKFVQGKTNKSENILLKEYYRKLSINGNIEISKEKEESIRTSILHEIRNRIHEENVRLNHRNATKSTKNIFFRTGVAAIIVLGILLVGSVFYHQLDISRNNLAYDMDFPPGKEKAILTMSNGEKINLLDLKEGDVLDIEGGKITKSAEGQVIYNASSNTDDLSDRYNSISTPVGGKYQVILPDGSKVWLNSSSEIEYPIAFSSDERKVKLKGEAYFEVESDLKRPFSVESEGQVVTVHGTHFNINSYSEEGAIKTTLVEGSISVKNTLTNDSKLLIPGNQSAIYRDSLAVYEVSVDESIAWKDGYFLFNETDLKSIMRQIERWYGVEVEYESIPDVEFFGKISRSSTLSRVLKLMEQTSDVNFVVKGDKISCENLGQK